MEHDAEIKRAKFINSAVEIGAAPAEGIKAMKVHSSSFYWSNLWDMGGERAEQVLNAYNTSMKLAWGLPQHTRTFILKQVLCCGFTSAKVDILTRFVKFFHGLRFTCSTIQAFYARTFILTRTHSPWSKNPKYGSLRIPLGPQKGFPSSQWSL